MRKLLVILMFVPSMAQAEFFSGNDLLKKFNGDTVDQIIALGYVQGAVDALSGSILCLPPTVTAGQVGDMISNYLRNTPAERHFSADSIISKALITVWPCAKRKGSV